MSARAAGRCRSCGAEAVVPVLDLGRQPVADLLADDEAEARSAPRYRLALATCTGCGLVQLDADTPVLPNAEHGHGSAFSGTVLAHERGWADELLADLPAGARVLDVASGSGGLLRPFADAGHRVRGRERDGELARAATAAGIPTDGPGAPGEAAPSDLVLVNHVLSHADDLDGTLAELCRAVAPGGTLAVEFHSALGILTGGQFDVVCHAHRSYLSLSALVPALARHGLTVTTARRLPLHGGVVRLRARHSGAGVVADEGVAQVLTAERAAGLGTVQAWAPVADRAADVRERLRAEIAAHREAGREVAGYGAPSRGTTLLNYCGIGSAELPRTADRSPAKQGRFVPGAGTAVCTVEELLDRRPDVVVVLVWPLRQEVLDQLAGLRRAGTRFLFPLPEPELVA